MLTFGVPSGEPYFKSLWDAIGERDSFLEIVSDEYQRPDITR